MNPRLFLPLVPAALRPVLAGLLDRLDTAERRLAELERAVGQAAARG